MELHRNDDGEIQFQDTGDSLIDKWEAAIARGEHPDLTEAFSPEAWDNIHKKSKGGKLESGKVKALTLKDTNERIQREAQAQGFNPPNFNPQYYVKPPRR